MQNFAITAIVRKKGEHQKLFSFSTFIIWDLSFTQGWITEEVTTQLNLCLEHLPHTTIN